MNTLTKAYSYINIDKILFEVIAVKDSASAAKIFKALGDENRLHILNDLCGGEKCACDLLEDMKITQPTLSHHMKILCDSGIVKARKEGKWTHYSINPNGIKTVMGSLWKFVV